MSRLRPFGDIKSGNAVEPDDLNGAPNSCHTTERLRPSDYKSIIFSEIICLALQGAPATKFHRIYSKDIPQVTSVRCCKPRSML